ncbi:MAG: porin [Isosphaeraceae bacterium]
MSLSSPAAAYRPEEDGTSAASVASIEQRLRALEEANRRLSEENRVLHSELRTIRSKLDDSLVRTRQAGTTQPPRSDRSDEGGAGARDNPALPPDGGATGSPGAGPAMSDGDIAQPPRSSRSDEGGAGARDNPAEPSRTTPFRGPGKIPMGVNFGPGIEFETLNEEYLFQIHNQTQVEGRFYNQPNQTPGAGGFDIPRERFIIAGRLSKPIEYDASLESAYGTVNLLNAFLNWHYDDRLMVKLGRYKVPYLYEYYAISNADLLQPERSLFGANFGLNRGVGAQLWGQLLKKRVDYAVGIFDGPRNQQLDFNQDKDAIAYLNFRPFQEAKELEALKWFNVGGSYDYGVQNNAVYPTALRTSVSGTNNPGAFQAAPSFLQWNSNVIERGSRQLWSAFIAYYYKQLSVIAEAQGGYAGYALVNRRWPQSTNVPLGGYYVTAGYFLTGEEVNRRSQVRPRKPFDLRKKTFGLGAWELEARYSLLTIGDEIFSAGLADSNLWTDRVQSVDLGLNWYMNEYVKIYLDWQHSEFGSPTLYAPGRLQQTSDLFWIRGQIYF